MDGIVEIIIEPVAIIGVEETMDSAFGEHENGPSHSGHILIDDLFDKPPILDVRWI
jgi:hypothetical protein